MCYFYTLKNMKLKKYLIILTVCVAASSCCKKESCLEVVGVPLTFYGYNPADLDTLYITGYEKGTGFGKIGRDVQRDTVQAGFEAGTYMLKLKDNTGISPGALPGSALPDDYDWQIYIPAVNQTIKVSDYGYHNYTCESCGRGKGREIQSLSSCTINGAIVQVDAARVYK